MELYPLPGIPNPTTHPKEFWCDEPVSGVEALPLLLGARMELLGRHPFFGKLASNLTLVKSKITLTTAVTARGIFFYNEQWINHMSKADAVWSMAHEVMHLYQRFFARLPKGASFRLFNLAGDYVLETQLFDSGLEQGKHSKVKTTEDIRQKVVDLGGTVEKVYQWLLENQTEEEMGDCKACKQMMEKLKKEAEQEQKEKEKENAQLNADGDEDGDEGAPGGKSAGATEGDGEGEGDGHGDGEFTPHTCGHGGMGCCSGKMSETDELDPIEEQEWTEKLIAAKMHAESKGNMPAGIGAEIDSLTTSKVKWTDHLKTAATRLFGHPRYTYKRPSRRGPMLRMRMPGKISDGKTAIGAIDTSASMSEDEVRQCVSEFSAIMKACGCNKLWLILHDTRVYFSGWVEEADLTILKMARGGTSHMGVFACLNKTHPNLAFNVPSEEEVTLAVLFTDLGTDFPDQAPEYDVLWAVPSNGSPGMEMPVPFGKKIEVEMSNEE